MLQWCQQGALQGPTETNFTFVAGEQPSSLGACRGDEDLRPLSHPNKTRSGGIQHTYWKQTGLFFGPYKQICIEKLEGVPNMTVVTRLPHDTSRRVHELWWPTGGKEAPKGQRDGLSWALSACSLFRNALSNSPASVIGLINLFLFQHTIPFACFNSILIIEAFS